MPRVYERKAGKDYPTQGIKKGETYYAWAFYRGPEIKSKTRPRQSQLTQNSTLSIYYSAIEVLDDALGQTGDADNPRSAEDVKAILNEAAGQMKEAAEDADGKLENMGDGLRQGDTGQQLEDWKSQLEDYADAIEAIDVPERETEPDDAETSEEAEVDAEEAAKTSAEDAETEYQDSLDAAIQEAIDADPGIG